MRFAVLLVAVSDLPRVTTLTRSWVERACASVERYFEDQSGGAASPDFEVFEWVTLERTIQEWNDLGGNVSEAVNSEIERTVGIDLKRFDRFVYILDSGTSEVGVSENNETRIAAHDFDPALLAHEIAHVYGADDTFLETPSGPSRYDALFCIMGREGSKYSFQDPSLISAQEGAGQQHCDCGPGMCVPSLLATGWLDLARHGVKVEGFAGRSPGTTVRIRALDGAPQASAGPPMFCYVDDGGRYLVEYRVPNARWDAGLPYAPFGWLVVYRTPLEGPLLTLEVASFQATVGATRSFGGPDTFYLFGAGPLRMSVMACDVVNSSIVLRFARQTGKVPTYEREFSGFRPDDGCLLWTDTSGWRQLPASSDLAEVLRKTAELDELRALSEVAGHRHAPGIVEATRMQQRSLQQLVSRLSTGPSRDDNQVVASITRLREWLRAASPQIDQVELSNRLSDVEALARRAGS